MRQGNHINSSTVEFREAWSKPLLNRTFDVPGCRLPGVAQGRHRELLDDKKIQIDAAHLGAGYEIQRKARHTSGQEYICQCVGGGKEYLSAVANPCDWQQGGYYRSLIGGTSNFSDGEQRVRRVAMANLLRHM